jgi:hypothetical protein
MIHHAKRLQLIFYQFCLTNVNARINRLFDDIEKRLLDTLRMILVTLSMPHTHLT